jgi:hypothetical protein
LWVNLAAIAISGKTANAVMAKEVLIATGREAGASIPQLASITSIDPSSVSRRCDSAKLSLTTNTKLAYAKLLVEQNYCAKIAESNV